MSLGAVVGGMTQVLEVECVVHEVQTQSVYSWT